MESILIALGFVPKYVDCTYPCTLTLKGKENEHCSFSLIVTLQKGMATGNKKYYLSKFSIQDNRRGDVRVLGSFPDTEMGRKNLVDTVRSFIEVANIFGGGLCD